MKNFTLCSLAIYACTLLSTSLHAQDRKPSLSLGAETAIPTGNLSLITPFGLGASAKLVLPASGIVSITASGGYIYYMKKNYFGEKIGGFHAIPFKGGIRLSLSKGFYLEPQAGYTTFGKEATGDEEGGSDSGFTYAGNIGYLAGKNFDISAGFENSRIEGENFSYIGIRLAYNFILGK
jgi:hypothetical protein